MRRLMDSCRVYRMEPRWSQAELSQAVLDTVRDNGFKSCYIRPLVYRGYEQLGLDPMPCPVDASIIVWEWNQMMGAGALDQGIDVGVSSWTRLAPNTLPALAKGTANYANSGLIKMQAVARRLRATPLRSTSAACSAKAAARTCSWCGTA